jgi:hypothetical protein
MKKLANLTYNYLKNKDFLSKIEYHYIFAKWEQIAGKTLSNICRPKDVANGRLIVAVKDSMWSYQIINKYSQTILEKINGFFKNKKINKIVCVVDLDIFKTPEKKESIKERVEKTLPTTKTKRSEDFIPLTISQVIEDDDLQNTFKTLLKTINNI